MIQYLILSKSIPISLTLPLKPFFRRHTLFPLRIPFFNRLIFPPFLVWRTTVLVPHSTRRRNFLLGHAFLDEFFEGVRIFRSSLQHVPIGSVAFPRFVFQRRRVWRLVYAERCGGFAFVGRKDVGICTTRK